MFKIVACSLALSSMLLPGLSMAKLPAMSDEAKLKAAEASAKSAWTDKVAGFQLCQAMDRTAEAYRRSFKSTGKDTPQPTPSPTLPCSDPGQFAYAPTPITPDAQKPLEASGAHSPPGPAQSPPSQKATAAEIAGKK